MGEDTADTLVDPSDMELPPAENAGGEPQQEVDPVRAARRYKAAVFTLLTLAGIVTFGAAVRFWLPPWGPIAAFCLLGAGPLFIWSFIGAIVFDPSKTKDGLINKNSPDLGVRLRLALAPVLGGAACGAVISGLWFAPPIRLLATKLAASQRLSETLDAALLDQHESVRLAACEGMAEIKDQTSQQMFGALADPSDKVVDCALGALPAMEVAPPALVAMAGRWQTELVSIDASTQDGDRACMLSNRMRLAERKGLRQASMHLMSCALQAEAQPARECCAQSFRAILGSNEVEAPMVMPPTPELVQRGFFDAVPELLAVAFGTNRELEQTRMALRLDTPRSRAWAMELGCDTLQAGGAEIRYPISEAMANAVSSATCHLDPATETTVRLWTAVCSELYSPAAVATADGSESEKFCRAINGTLVVDASNEARTVVQESLRQAREPGRRTAMMKALLDYGGKMAKAAVSEGDDAPRAPSSLFGGPSGFFNAANAGGPDAEPTGDPLQDVMKIFMGSADKEPKAEERPEDFLDRYMRDQAKMADKPKP